MLVNNYEQQIFQEHGDHDRTILKLEDNCTVLIFYTDTAMTLRLGKLINFGGKKWKCKSFLTAEDSYFSTQDGFVKTSDTNNFIPCSAKIENVELVSERFKGYVSQISILNTPKCQ